MGAAGSKDGSQRPKFADDFYGKSHRRIARPLARQFASGVKYNIKIVIRGDHCTGKSVLLKMLNNFGVQLATIEANSSSWFGNSVSGTTTNNASLIDQGSLVPKNLQYIPTRQIQVTNLRWKYKETDDVVKVEIWDVVDQALRINSPTLGSANLDAPAIVNEKDRDLLDADSMDVYRHANGVIFLFDLTKTRTTEYVTRQLAKVPKDLPVLILGNFADKVFDNFIDLDFQKRHFEAIRGGGGINDGLAAPLHFMIGSLLQVACPHNPPAGLINAIMKFFELSFLQMQRNVFRTRLSINEEQIEQAQQEWIRATTATNNLNDDSHLSTSNVRLTLPETAAKSITVATNGTGNLLTSIELLSTDTLTKKSMQAWAIDGGLNDGDIPYALSNFNPTNTTHPPCVGPVVNFLLDALKRGGCPYGRASFSCIPCKETAGSGKFEGPNDIKICQDAILSKKHVEDTMSHELIHAFDYCRTAFNLNDCKQRACSEIRAANLSGECKWTRELKRGNFKIANQHKECVLRRTKLSLGASMECKDLDLDTIIKGVWDSCYNDTEPFIDVP